MVLGPEEALARLLVERMIAARHALGEPVSVLKVRAGEPRAAEAIAAAAEPTLFGDTTLLVVSGIEAAGEDVVQACQRAATAADPGAPLILVHSGAARGRGAVNAAQKAGAAVLEVRPVATSAIPAVLTTHAKRRGGVLTSDAAAAVMHAVGEDLTALVATVEQLLADSPDGRIDAELARNSLTATAGENQFEIADLVWRRQGTAALEAFRRYAAQQGASSAAVTVVAALSYSLRSLARYVAERPGGAPWEVARQLGVPVWKVDALAAQAVSWRPGQLARAAVALADADADAKGGLGDAGALDPDQKNYRVEKLIIELAEGP